MKSSADGDGSQHDGSNMGQDASSAGLRAGTGTPRVYAFARAKRPLGDLLDQLRVGLAALLPRPRQILAVGQVGIRVGLDDVDLNRRAPRPTSMRP